MDNAFRVRAGLEDRAPFLKLTAQAVGIGQVAVMGDGTAAHVELGEQGLDVADCGLPLGTSGGVPGVAQRNAPGQQLDHLGVSELVADMADAADGVELRLDLRAVTVLACSVGDDPGGFLPAVLQSMETQNRVGRRLVYAEDTVDAAFLAQLVIIERIAKPRTGCGVIHVSLHPGR